MTKKSPRETIYFERPVISPRLYTARGPSGWPETFSRQKLDAELQRFLGTVPIAEAAELFITQRELSDDQKPEHWPTVAGFLARLLEIHPFDVPYEAVIAFWAQVELARRAREAN